MLYCAHHGAGHADYTFTEYPELENALLEKLDVDHNGKLDSTDVFLMMYYVACNGSRHSGSLGGFDITFSYFQYNLQYKNKI